MEDKLLESDVPESFIYEKLSSGEEKRKVNVVYMAILCSFTTIGGFLFGYDTSVIAGANLYIDEDFPEVTDFQRELIVSFTMLGAAIGSMIGGPIADAYGRRIVILMADIMFTTGCILMAFTPSIAVLIFGRFVVGLGVGTAAMVVPVYLAELAPAEIRGLIVNLNVCCITIGQLLALVICLMLGNKWRWMLGLAGVPSTLQGIGILFLVESPRWSFKVGNEKDALKALRNIYIGTDSQLESIIKEQKHEAYKVKKYENLGYWKLFEQLFTKYRPCLIAGCGLQMFQQLCGINTAMYYGPEIMKAAGFGDDNNKAQALISSIPLAASNALGCMLALLFIDNCGRRWIMLRCLPLMALFIGLLGVSMGLVNHTDESFVLIKTIGSWGAASSIMLFLLFFAIGMSPTPWTVNSEIYPLHTRAISNSLSSTTNWISNFVIASSFLTILNHVPFGDILAFMMIVVFCLLACLFVFKKVPETKGLTMEEVLDLFVGKDNNQNKEIELI